MNVTASSLCVALSLIGLLQPLVLLFSLNRFLLQSDSDWATTLWVPKPFTVSEIQVLIPGAHKGGFQNIVSVR